MEMRCVMCFRDDDECDWYVGDETRSIVLITDPKGCCECGRRISGEMAIKIHQIEDESLRDFDEECEPMPLREWIGHVCGACDLTRFRVHLHELAEGCPEYESWCPYGELREYCYDAEFDMSSAEDGAAWLASKFKNGGAE